MKKSLKTRSFEGKMSLYEGYSWTTNLLYVMVA